MNNDHLTMGAIIAAGAIIGWQLAGGGKVRAREGSELRILDRTAQARLSSRAAPHTRQRDPGIVDSVVLHQMGFSRGNDPSKYDSVTAHYKVLPDGTVIQSHFWSTRLPASNGLNQNSVSVEFAGNLPKETGSRDPNDFWKPQNMGMNNLTPAAAAAGRKLMAHLWGRGIRKVFAHRQSAAKGLDPGPAIWSWVGEYAKQLGMTDGGPGFHIGSGSEIPTFWRTRLALA